MTLATVWRACLPPPRPESRMLDQLDSCLFSRLFNSPSPVASRVGLVAHRWIEPIVESFPGNDQHDVKGKAGRFFHFSSNWGPRPSCTGSTSEGTKPRRTWDEPAGQIHLSACVKRTTEITPLFAQAGEQLGLWASASSTVVTVDITSQSSKSLNRGTNHSAKHVWLSGIDNGS